MAAHRNSTLAMAHTAKPATCYTHGCRAGPGCGRSACECCELWSMWRKMNLDSIEINTFFFCFALYRDSCTTYDRIDLLHWQTSRAAMQRNKKWVEYIFECEAVTDFRRISFEYYLCGELIRRHTSWYVFAWGVHAMAMGENSEDTIANCYSMAEIYDVPPLPTCHLRLLYSLQSKMWFADFSICCLLVPLTNLCESNIRVKQFVIADAVVAPLCLHFKSGIKLPTWAMKSEVEWPWPIRVNADSVCLGFFSFTFALCARARWAALSQWRWCIWWRLAVCGILGKNVHFSFRDVHNFYHIFSFVRCVFQSRWAFLLLLLSGDSHTFSRRRENSATSHSLSLIIIFN